ncbi:MAG: DUF3857 domain-containing protein [Candidatus Zixiibacteriota bacterium]
MACRSIVHSTLTAILVVLCVSSAFGSKWGKVTPEEWQLMPPPTHADINAAVVFDRCTLNVGEEVITIRRHVRLKVYRKAGADEIGERHIYYRDGDKLTNLRAQTILPDGKTVKVESRDIFTKTVAGERYKTFAFPVVDSGCILEYQYTNINQRYYYLKPWYFQGGLYTFESQFTLELAPGFVYSSSLHRATGGAAEAVEDECLDPANPGLKIKQYTWTQRNLPPITDEPFMAARENYYFALRCQLVEYRTPYSVVRFVKDWADLGKELDEFVGAYAYGGGVDDLAKRLTANDSTQSLKAERLYDFVSDSISSQPDAEGKWFTNKNLSQLLKNGFGTGDEKNLLLLQMLRKSGITAWPVFVATRDRAQLDPNNCHRSQFNHIMLFAQLDSSAMLMDASSKYSPYSVLPANCLVDAGFLVDGKDSKLIRITRADPRTYRLDATDIVIDSSGNARCSTTCQMTGYFVPQYGELLDQQAPDEFVKKYFLSKASDDAELDSNSFSTNDAGNLTVEATYSLPGYARRLDNNTLIRPPTFYFAENPFKRERRSFPVDFNFPFTYHNVVRVSSATGATSSTLPRDTIMEIPGISFQRASVFENGTAVVDTRLIVTEPVFEPGRYRELRRFFDEVAKAQAEEVILASEM